jgi:TolB-like protein
MRNLSTWAVVSLLAPALAGAQTPAATRTRVAVLDLRAIGVEASKAELLSEVALTEAASLPGLEVIGRSDVQSILGFEKQKKILGCGDDSACIAEIGGALGVRLVLVGSVGKIGALYRIDLKVLDTSKASAVRRYGANVEGAEEKMVAAVQAAVRELFAKETGGAMEAPPAGAAPPAAAAVATSGAPPVAAGAARRRHLFAVGARLAYGISGGKFEPGEAQADWIKGQFALQLDGAFYFTERLSLGIYLAGGIGAKGDLVDTLCTDFSLSSCTVAVGRAGLDLAYRFIRPEARFVPWVSVGLGGETFRLDASGDLVDLTATASGFEPIHVELGGDFVSGSARLGPYLAFAVARYTSGKIESPTGSVTLDLSGTSHSYLFLGVRGALDL